MQTKDAIKAAMDLSLMVLNTYVSDFSDSEMLSRPTPDSNHVAWQYGHLISSEVSLLNMICPGQAAVLPNGFAERHSKENAQSNDASQFGPKQTYLDLCQQVHAATLIALDKLTDQQLDASSPEHFRNLAPTVGHMFVLIATHPMMHVGQIAVVRRQLGKPILI
jgi:DinB superfamily